MAQTKNICETKEGQTVTGGRSVPSKAVSCFISLGVIHLCPGRGVQESPPPERWPRSSRILHVLRLFHHPVYPGGRPAYKVSSSDVMWCCCNFTFRGELVDLDLLWAAKYYYNVSDAQSDLHQGLEFTCLQVASTHDFWCWKAEQTIKQTTVSVTSTNQTMDASLKHKCSFDHLVPRQNPSWTY